MVDAVAPLASHEHQSGGCGETLRPTSMVVKAVDLALPGSYLPRTVLTFTGPFTGGVAMQCPRVSAENLGTLPHDIFM